ncbi:MAG: NADH-quinone oxidoreductase subunit NuoH [Phycisphaerae bacterium]|nr:NADH-quinone oxidoreductase subunit NuoH [Phycisphaerae bacterium]
MWDPAVKRVESILRNWRVWLAVIVVLPVLAAVVLWLALPLYKDPAANILSNPIWFPIIVAVVMLLSILTSTAVCILAERKLAGFTQDRKGPNRVGFWGLLQPMADGMKFFFKEDIIPHNVDKPLFMLAPCITLTISLIGFAIIPWAGDVHFDWMAAGETVSTQVASLNIGILYILAVGSIGVYGIVLAGYASNNKYSFYGGIRAAAQMISYELPMGLALLCLLLVCGTLRLEEIVNQQAQTGVWYVFVHPLPFLLFLTSVFAEANRMPFDLCEAEQELVGGFHTEYSSMKFAMFFLGEYAHMITGSAIMIALFFGGWHCWGLTSVENTAWWAMLIKLGVYIAKIAIFIWFFMVIRWTIPRFRFDQLMRLCWLALVPVGIVLLIATGVLSAVMDLQDGWNWLASLAVNVVVLIIMLAYAARSKTSITGRQGNMPDVDVRPT